MKNKNKKKNKNNPGKANQKGNGEEFCPFCLEPIRYSERQIEKKHSNIIKCPNGHLLHKKCVLDNKAKAPEDIKCPQPGCKKKIDLSKLPKFTKEEKKRIQIKNDEKIAQAEQRAYNIEKKMYEDRQVRNYINTSLPNIMNRTLDVSRPINPDIPTAVLVSSFNNNIRRGNNHPDFINLMGNYINHVLAVDEDYMENRINRNVRRRLRESFTNEYNRRLNILVDLFRQQEEEEQEEQKEPQE